MDELVYPKPAGAADKRGAYFYDLLKISLEKSVDKFGPYSLKYSETHLPSTRIPVELKRGQFVNVLTSPMSKQLESLVIPIKIPLVKGIQGIRLLLIKKSKQAQFAKVDSLAQLKQFVFGQGVGWLDSLILNAGGLEVGGSTEYDGLFKMLAFDRFDAFPRGLNEIFPELRVRKTHYPELAVEKKLVIYYDLPVYFFVKLGDHRLHSRITYGLNQALEDGSFDKFFYNHYGEDIINAKLDSRILINLPNPYISAIDKSEQAQFWLPFIIERTTTFSSKMIKPM